MLAVLRELAQESEVGALFASPVFTAPAAGYSDEIINLDDLDDASMNRKSALLGDVRETVSRFGTQEFNVGQTESALRRLNKTLPAGKTPRAKISQTLSELCEEGYITKTYTGRGNVPHKYRLTSTLTEKEKALLEAQKSPGPLTTGLGI